MNLFDFHNHTTYSFDGHNSQEELIKEALKKGITYLGFSEHKDYNSITETVFDTKTAYKDFLNLQDKYNGKINLRFGIELGQPIYNLEDSSQIISDNYFDYILLSLHNFEDGLDFYFIDYEQTDIHDILDEYLKEMLLLLDYSDYNIVSHLTYPTRCRLAHFKQKTDLSLHRDAIAEVLKKIIQKGKSLEINTSLLHKGFDTVTPENEIIKLYKDLGGERVTTGSDSHYAAHCGEGIRETENMLFDIGFRYMTVFENKIESFIPIR